MALTQGSWSEKTVAGHAVFTCSVAGTTAENDIYTLKTPTSLNTAEPWTLFVYVNEDLTAAGASALDVWGGYSDSFAITGNDTTVDATDGALVYAVTTDIDAGGTLVLRVVPATKFGGVAQVATTPALAVLPPLPYFAFNIDMTAALQDAATITFVIVQ